LASGLIGNIDEVFVQKANNSLVLFESACAPNNNCNTDQLAFRAVLARALGATLALTRGSSISESLYNRISTTLRASAIGAAAACSGGDNGTLCGSDWSYGDWDGSSGLGQSLSALEVILANLPAKALANANNTTALAANGTSSNNASSNGSDNGTSGIAPSNAGVGTTASMLVTVSTLCAVAFLLL